MALACQKDSYLRELISTVKSCEPATLTTALNSKKQKVSGFEVVLLDTVLFPEGGGQPDDRGTLNDIDVLRVTRCGAEAVHFLPAPLDVGAEVTVRVAWPRRWDHMQQHSGQHLVTAIADDKFGFPTTSWNLGERVSTIEMDTPAMNAEQLAELEDLVNERIRTACPMYPTLYAGVEDPALSEVRTRGLPEDHVGEVRVVTIEGIESNMCCGTHVSNLCHLQMIKLLGTEKAKKGRVNVSFVAGDRVMQYMARAVHNERGLTAVLKGGPDIHVELADKMLKSLKLAQKNSLNLLRDASHLEAQCFKADPTKPRLLSMHRREGDNEYMNNIINDIADENVLIFLTTGDDKGQGLFMLSGTEAAVAELAPKVCELIEGKGAGKKGRYQGRANKLSKREKAEAVLRDYLTSQGS